MILPTRAYWMTRLAGAAALVMLIVTGVEARTWSNADGSKTFEAELKSYDPATGAVEVIWPNGATMIFNQEKLSPTDIAFLKEQSGAGGSTSGLPAAFLAGQLGTPAVPPAVVPIFEKYCFKCHEGADADGDLTLDNLSSLKKPAYLDALNRAESQLFFDMMPPKKSKQPSPEERQVLFGWVTGELRKNHASGLDQKARTPNAGNWVDHRLLFSGTIKDKPYTPARRWLLSPQIFLERVFDIFEIAPQERFKYKNGFDGLEQPFTLPGHSGVRDYDTASLEGGSLFAMLNNARWISGKIVGAYRMSHGEPSLSVFPNQKYLFVPWQSKIQRRVPLNPVFDKFFNKEAAPADEDITDAVQLQFQRALKRAATDAEVKRYLKLTRDAIKLVGNINALQQMLQGVLLESDFVYRVELGDGAPDPFGRMKLAPDEAAYAIAYALGDNGPDAGLLAAAKEGRLSSKGDYEREVLRLLADKTYFRGEIEPALYNPHEPHATTHPKTIRFFREFFGYPAALNIFKDNNRSNGYYTPEIAKSLIKEADLFLLQILNSDKNVFSEMLGSELFFVAPIKGASAKIDQLNALYERFKDRDWKVVPKPTPENKNPTKLSEEDKAFLRPILDGHDSDSQLYVAMRHIDRSKRFGLKHPHPQWSYAFNNFDDQPSVGPFATPLTLQAHSYSIDPFHWEYPREQPFKIPHRKGILTHPAWLIAFSQNTATDPVRRGRWIREKLLAGSVPEVPITVDAKIPEDPHKGLRDRLDSVTKKQECWKCHEHMNPLGLAFEKYDDFGRFRTEENLEYPENIIKKTTFKGGMDIYKTAPLTTTGTITSTGESGIDGDVTDAIDLITRLSKSERVRQSIIRHAFRFYMGRNELLSDSKTLIEADQSYLKSGGSFNAVIASLLTSDSFMYRK